MKDFPVRSPAGKVGGIVYFGRMLDKIRVHAKNALPADYQPNLGKGFDAACVAFLKVHYRDLVEQASRGVSDDEILAWCFENGRKPTDREIYVWNEFMRKCGWNDDISETLTRRKTEGGFADRDDIQTMFQFIDADEGRETATSNEL